MHILCDLHLEFGTVKIQPTEADVIVLAGDIHLGREGRKWARSKFPNTPVIYSQTTLHALNTELGRLLRRGLITRYAHGRYGPTQGVASEDIQSAVDPGAYITRFYALFRRHLVTQAPNEVTCFTNRRHNRKAKM